MSRDGWFGPRWIGLLALVLGSLSGATALQAQWDVICYIVSAAGQPVSLCVYPDGDGSRPGDSLDACFTYGGTIADATITLNLYDWDYNPVPYFPAEDLWLETEDGGMVLCPGGSIADSDTDLNGMTTFSGPLRAGGSGEGIIVLVNGMLCPEPALAIKINSPDLNGDLVVNLSDIVLFADSFLGEYSYACDFYWDGDTNLSDLVMLSLGMGAACP